jgi:DNA-binding NtrC family response regulator
MRRSVLFIGYEPPLHEEIQEFLDGMHGEAFFANTVEEAIRVLDENKINKAVLNLRSMADAAVLRYINLYYGRRVEVIVSASPEFDEIISVFRENNYSRLHQPLKLEDLKEKI